MSNVLWAKPGMDIDADIQRFLAGDDVILDREFIRYDIRASGAHAEGLERIGILTADERAAIARELAELDADVAAGRFLLDDRFEDMHSAIEARLIERLGDVGKKIHTGRSRNDQVLNARIVALNAMPWVSRSSFAAAMTRVTSVPCPSSSPKGRPAPVTSPDCGWMRPVNSWLLGSIPESITPTITPCPDAPA